MDKSINPIALWSKFKDYSQWCYNYRIPNEKEFINGFKYEFANFTMQIPSELGYNTEVFWTKFTYGEISEEWPHKENKIVLNNLQAYLEAGYIRVKKANYEGYITHQKMEIYHVYITGVEIVDGPHGKYIDNKKYQMGVHKERPYGHLVIEAPGIYSSDHCEDWLCSVLKGTDLSEPKDSRNVMRLRRTIVIDGVDYRIQFSPTRSNLNDTDWFRYAGPLRHLNSEDSLYICTRYRNKDQYDNLRFGKLVDDQDQRDTVYNTLVNLGVIPQGLPKRLVDSELYLSQHPQKQIINTNMPNLRVFSRIGEKVKDFLKKTSIVPTLIEVKPNERYLGKEQGWKPLHNLVDIKNNLGNVQPAKSDDSLVYIASKNHKFVHRIPRKLAVSIVNGEYNKKAKNPFSFISKTEGRKLERTRGIDRPIPMKKLTPSQGSPIDPSTGERIYRESRFTNPPHPFKGHSKRYITKTTITSNLKRTDLDIRDIDGVSYKGKDKVFVYHDEDGNNVTEKVFEPVDTDLITRTTVCVKDSGKSKRSKKQQGVKKQPVYTYECNIEGEFDKSIIATSEQGAKDKVISILKKEGSILPISSLVVKRSPESDTNVLLKKDRSTMSFFMPHVIDVPMDIDKKTGKPISRYTRIVFDKFGKPTKEPILTYTKYTKNVRPGADPLQKNTSPKKWKCPINQLTPKQIKKKELKEKIETERILLNEELKNKRLSKKPETTNTRKIVRRDKVSVSN